MAYLGQHQSKEGMPSSTLEFIAGERLYMWHAFFGMSSCANDINVLNTSTVQNKIANGTFRLTTEYFINVTTHHIAYLLADGIYPKCSCFVQTVSHLAMKKEKVMARFEEAARDDAKKLFNVIQAKLNII